MDDNPGATLISDDQLLDYLADRLPPAESARIEKAARDSAELRERMEALRTGRSDDRHHAVGAIWRRRRLTCPTREQLGGYLMEAMDEEMITYIRFHIDVVQCPYCRANLEDLKEQAIQAAAAAPKRQFRSRIFQSSLGLLSGERED